VQRGLAHWMRQVTTGTKEFAQAHVSGHEPREYPGSIYKSDGHPFVS